MKKKHFDFASRNTEILRRAAAIFDESSYMGIFPVKGGCYAFGTKFRRNSDDDAKFIHEHFGGYKSNQVCDDGSVFFWYSTNGPRWIFLLRAMLPYLVNKAELAKAISDFKQTIEENGNKKLSAETREWRALEIKRIKEMNKKFFSKIKSPDHGTSGQET